MTLGDESGLTQESLNMGSPRHCLLVSCVGQINQPSLYHAAYLQTEEKGKVNTIAGC